MRMALGCVLFTALLTGAPRVEKVEPPSWWVGSTWSPVRLMMHGQGLGGARVSMRAPLSAARTWTNEAGTYLFADVTIPKTAKPGKYSVTIQTAEGRCEVEFEVLPALERKGRFQGFGPDDVLYLIMPDRFANGDTANDDPASARGMWDRRKTRYYHGGDFQGILDRAGYLKELGVTALWLNPWYDNVDHLNERERYDNTAITDYHGYGAVDFYGVEQHFGDLALLRRMNDALRGQGIKMIQDQVANHTGPYHDWVQDAPTKTWFNGSQSKHLANDWQTWTLMDAYATAATRRTTLDGWFIDILPDLNQADPEARRYLIQNSLWWVGVAGLDGIRQDTLPYAPRDFWRDWMAAVHREFPGLKAVGEVLDGDPAFVAFFQGGVKRFDGIDSGVDALFDFPLMYAMRSTFGRGRSVKEAARVLAHDWLYADPRMLVTFLGLHDVTRFMNEQGATVEGMRLAYTFLLTSRGIPMIYYGDEIAMPGGGDPDNRRDFPGGWKEDSRDAFTAGGRTAEENGLFEHVKRLIALRKGSEALRRGVTKNVLVTEQQWVYTRATADETVLVMINNAGEAVDIEAESGSTGFANGAVLRDRLGVIETATVTSGKIRARIPARSGVVLTR